MNSNPFMTQVAIAPAAHQLTHAQRVWTLGSCFSDEVGRRLSGELFNVEVNPMGILFNPLSIARALERVISGEPCTAEELVYSELSGLWHCFDFHSSFSTPTAEATLANINSAVGRLHSSLPTLSCLMLTFGSARAFVRRSSGNVVANCHKFPASEFEVRDYTAQEIADRFAPLLQRLKVIAPQLQVLLTVSPVRHKAYGFHADKLSKANLLIATDMITARCEFAEYFPAYEIMTDELRDYRFYAADMIHPSDTAADYIYRRFADIYFSSSTRSIAKEGAALVRRMAHRPLHGASTSCYLAFRQQTAQDVRNFMHLHPETAEAVNRFLNHNDLHL